MADVHQRGGLLEDLLNRMFMVWSVPVVEAFRRNAGGEQIDGAVRIGGWHYLIECKWLTGYASPPDLDALCMKVQRSGRQTMGLFLAVNGWTSHVPNLLKQNPDKTVILAHGHDLRQMLALQVNPEEVVPAKVAHLNLRGEPFLSVDDYLRRPEQYLAREVAAS